MVISSTAWARSVRRYSSIAWDLATLASNSTRRCRVGGLTTAFQLGTLIYGVMLVTV